MRPRNAYQKRRKNAGTTLIEVLVVIVVFLVGILAVVQVFPPGLSLLRTTRNNTVAAALGDAELQRIVGQPGELAEMILPVSYVNQAGGIRILVNTNRRPGDLMPDKDATPLPGRIDSQGNVLVGGSSIGNWMKVSGSNLFSRVIGETKPVPSPRRIPGLPPGSDYGGLLQLTFAPTYYFQTAAGIGEPGVVLMYGNDLARRWGDRNENRPSPTGRWRDYEFYFVEAANTDMTYFPGEDQVWISPARNSDFRIAFSFSYLEPNSGNVQQYDVIIQARIDVATPPPYAQVAGNFLVISLQQLVAEPDVFGNASQFSAANFRSAEFGSVRVSRVYRELPLATPFTGDPYEYKILGAASTGGAGVDYCMGTLLVNPAAFEATFRTERGQRIPLQANVDYTVLDWRIIRDEFRVPRVNDGNVKLTLNSIKPRSGLGKDGRPNPGLGIASPSLLPPEPNKTEDMVVVDLESGGLIMGNAENDPNAPGYPQNPTSAWQADKSNGVLQFRDIDGNAANGLSANIVFPTGDPLNPWSAPVLVPDISGRNVRTLYMGIGEWSAQPFKAARNYRISFALRANGLGPGECLVGGTPDASGVPQGNPSRIYFPLNDLGQRVLIGEIWYTTATGPRSFDEQEWPVTGIENVRGTDLAYLDITTRGGTVFDYANNYAVRRVRGASVKVRVLWNPSTFLLSTDDVANYNSLEEWMRNWRRTEIEGFRPGGLQR